MVEKIVGNIVNKISWKIDNTSLNKAKSAIKSIQDQMKGLKTAMSGASLNVNVRNARQQVRSYNTDRQKAHKTLLADMLREEDKAAARGQRIDGARRRQAVGGIVSDQPSMSAKGSLLAEMLREEDKTAKQYERLWEQAELRNAKNRRAIEAKALRDKLKAEKKAAEREEISRTRTIGLKDRLDTSKLSPRDIANQKRNIDLLNRSYIQGSISLREYSAGTQSVMRDMRRLSGSTKTVAERMHQARSAFVALTASATVFSAGVGITEVGKQYQALDIGMTAVFGDKAQDNLKFITAEADRVGVRLLSLTKDYVKFTASVAQSNLSVKEQRGLFSGMLEIGRTFGLSSDQLSLALKAISQSMGKGTTMSEELKLQFGDHIPAAIQMAADAMEVGKKEFLGMMEAGKVMSEDFWPKLIKEYQKLIGPATDKAFNSFAANQERLGNAFDSLRKAFFESGLENALNRFLEYLTDLSKSMEVLIKSGFGQFLSKIINNFAFLLGIFQALIHDLVVLALKIEWVNESFGNMDKGIKDITLSILAMIATYGAVKLLFNMMGSMMGRSKQAGDIMDDMSEKANKGKGKSKGGKPTFWGGGEPKSGGGMGKWAGRLGILLGLQSILSKPFTAEGLHLPGFTISDKGFEFGSKMENEWLARQPKMGAETPKQNINITVKGDGPLTEAMKYEIQMANGEMLQSISNSN